MTVSERILTDRAERAEAEVKRLQWDVSIMSRELMASAASLDAGEPPQRVASQIRYTLTMRRGGSRDPSAS